MQDSQHENTDSCPREAIIYLGPLQLADDGTDTVAGLVRRISNACDSQARTASSKWTVEWHSSAVEPDSETPSVNRVATINRTDSEGSAPVFDVFEYAWVDLFGDRWKRQSSFRRLISLVFTVLAIPTFVRFFLQPSTQRVKRGRMQLALAILMAVVVLAYLVLVVVAFWQTLIAVKPVFSGSAPDAVIRWPQIIVVAATFVGLGMDKIQNRVMRIGGGLAAAHRYLRGTTNQANELRAPLQNALERIREDSRYTMVTIIAYSFGSIVAIDNLFPTYGEPPRSYETVTKLVTIGAAYDFVQAAKPKYLRDRSARIGVPAEWLNVYSPVDLLGSDFKVLESSGEAATIAVAEDTNDQSVCPTASFPYDSGMELTWSNVIEFYGFDAHTTYWGSDAVQATNVFTWAIPRIYPEDDGPLR